MLSIQQSGEQNQVEQYSLNQLNNILALSFRFVDFQTALLFKTDPSESLVSNFKQEILPHLDDIFLTHDFLETFTFVSGDMFSRSRIIMNSGVFVNSDNYTSYDFMSLFSTWIEKKEFFDMSYFMIALVKQVFMHCNLLEYNKDSHRINLDLRASAITEQFQKLVLYQFARNLKQESEPNAPSLFEENTLAPLYAKFCFVAIISTLTQMEHFSLASALHNVLHLAKRYSRLGGDSNLNERQLAVIYAPCFLNVFGLLNNVYTKKNGFEEEVPINKQWKLMAAILTYTLEVNDFNFPYDTQKNYYQSMQLPSFLKNDDEMPDIPNVLGALSRANTLDSIIMSFIPSQKLASDRMVSEKNFSDIERKPVGLFGRFRVRKRSKDGLEELQPKAESAESSDAICCPRTKKTTRFPPVSSRSSIETNFLAQEDSKAEKTRERLLSIDYTNAIEIDEVLPTKKPKALLKIRSRQFDKNKIKTKHTQAEKELKVKNRFGKK